MTLVASPFLPKELILDISAGKLAALEWGDRGGKRVLALHGWSDNAASFTNLAEHLDGCHLVALDLIGHGRSSHRPTGVTYHFIDNIGDVIDAASALGWNSYTLMGHSLGAGIASLVASVARDAITELVLIDGIGPMAADPANAVARLADSIAKYRQFRARPRLCYPDWQSAIKAREEAGDLSFAAAQLLVERNAEQQSDGIRWRFDPRLKLPSPIYIAEEQAQASLRAITAPTLLIRAKGGLLDLLPFIEPRIKALKQIEVVVLPGGHHLHLDNPQPVAEQIVKFLTLSGEQSSSQINL